MFKCDTVFLLPPPTLSSLSNLSIPFIPPPSPPPPLPTASHQNLGLPDTTISSTTEIFSSALPTVTDQKLQVGIYCATES